MPDPRFYDALGPVTLGELARLTGAVPADGADLTRPIQSAAVLGQADESSVGFYFERRRGGFASRAELLRSSRAGACFVTGDDQDLAPAGCVALLCPAPQAAWAAAAERLHRPRRSPPTAQLIHPDALLEAGVETGPGVVIGAGAQIGAGTTIAAGAVIGPGVAIGRGCQIGANAVIGFALIGDRVRIYAGAVIGEAGFGVTAGAGGLIDIPQLGRVILQDGVVVGANTCIDRGGYEDTVIGENTKIDNLVQIAHNVVVGRNCVLAAFTGLSGSVKVGDRVQIGGAAGVADHVTIGDGANLTARIGVFRDIPAGETWAGLPGKPARQYFRETAWLQRAAARRKAGDEA